ncbi:ankyrin repeat domain-containing protein [Pararhodobacter sp. SW119]|uniref:ankyrin repeat domain-containing protein n=1 Tax=Pararhodobacter sp. SW119 TaxID=2780075 RepID=UPI001ADEE9E6|nr:ankyrin repeat domain-containing protein [Pararhodobacter sp. SW119]
MLDARDYLGQTALMLAADRKDAAFLRILRAHGVDLDAQDTLGRTALHAAVRSNAPDCFEMSLAAGANPTLSTCEGKTPAIYAAEFGRAQIFQRRLAHLARPVTEEELRKAREIAVRNANAYKAYRSEYRRHCVELSGRSAFKEIIAGSSKSA